MLLPQLSNLFAHDETSFSILSRNTIQCIVQSLFVVRTVLILTSLVSCTLYNDGKCVPSVAETLDEHNIIEHITIENTNYSADNSYINRNVLCLWLDEVVLSRLLTKALGYNDLIDTLTFSINGTFIPLDVVTNNDLMARAVISKEGEMLGWYSEGSYCYDISKFECNPTFAEYAILLGDGQELNVQIEINPSISLIVDS